MQSICNQYAAQPCTHLALQLQGSPAPCVAAPRAPAMADWAAPGWRRPPLRGGLGSPCGSLPCHRRESRCRVPIALPALAWGPRRALAPLQGGRFIGGRHASHALAGSAGMFHRVSISSPSPSPKWLSDWGAAPSSPSRGAGSTLTMRACQLPWRSSQLRTCTAAAYAAAARSRPESTLPARPPAMWLLLPSCNTEIPSDADSVDCMRRSCGDIVW